MNGRRFVMYCFTHGSFVCTGFLEAVADFYVVFLICFAIYLVCLGNVL